MLAIEQMMEILFVPQTFKSLVSPQISPDRHYSHVENNGDLVDLWQGN
jgi:hypothetical protein